MDYNFWDDRTHELEINHCKGCEDYQDGKCISNGGCGSGEKDDSNWILGDWYAYRKTEKNM